MGLEAPEPTGQRRCPTFQTGSAPEPCRWIRVARPTWPFSAATCRRASARQRTHPKLHSRRTQSGGRSARHNEPLAHTTQTSTASVRLRDCLPLRADQVGQASSLSVLGFQPVVSRPRRGAGSPGTDRPEALSYFPDRLCAGTMQMDPGGTANLAVLGGNLPPSFGTGSAPTQSCLPGAPRAAGASPATTGRWPVPPRPLLHRSG